jgi:carbon storage regulator
MAMLVLTRRVGEEIVVGDGIRVTVVAIKRGTIRLGITAPPSVTVLRQELLTRQAEGAALSAYAEPFENGDRKVT